jgi:5-methyltetrahydrofolate--homocysteine methyltransferase
MNIMELKSVYDSVVNGEVQETADGVRAALDAGLPADQVLGEALVPAMSEVGRLFEAQEYYVPEMLIAAKAMQAGLAILKPQLAKSNGQAGGRIVVGTVKGDLHDIGKNLVVMMLEGAGYQVVDLGVDVAPEKFIKEIQAGAQLVGISAMLTTTMLNMKVTIDAIKEAGVRDQVKIMVGGAPLTQTYAETIGADGFAQDASAAVRKATELLS